jgi:riboflavin synthase alpha subunit
MDSIERQRLLQLLNQLEQDKTTKESILKKMVDSGNILNNNGYDLTLRDLNNLKIRIQRTKETLDGTRVKNGEEGLMPVVLPTNINLK